MYLLSLVVEVFIRVVGIAPVHGGGLDVFVKRMPRPEHDRLQIAPCFFRPGNEGIAEFMGMMLGEQSLERRLYRTQVYRFCFFKIDVWKRTFFSIGEKGILRSTSTLPCRCLLVVQTRKFSSVRMVLSSLLRKPQ